jgi:cellulose synthase/poly-beta-1,6-N-acetylglucosamine synthase-like glycosyltransferase
VGAVDRPADDRLRHVHGAAELTTPRLSVLVPCRDAAGTLEDALASVEAQTFDDFEIIVVDAGSADATLDLLDHWRLRDRRLRVLRTAPSGIVAALNTGLAAANGEIIARMDADDVAWPERFRRQLGLLDARPDVAACGTGIRYFPRESLAGGALRYERWINDLLDGDDIARDMFVECPIPHPTLMIRRSVLDAVGGYRDPGWPEDYDLVLRLHAAGHAMTKTPDVLLDWRETPGRLSRTDPRYSEAAFRRCKAHWQMRTHLKDRDAVIWGPGPVGKPMARELATRRARIVAFDDLDPRKIGQTIHGAPVVDPAGIGRFRGAYALAAVAGPGPRAEIRAALESAGWREMRDFCVVA